MVHSSHQVAFPRQERGLNTSRVFTALTALLLLISSCQKIEPLSPFDISRPPIGKGGHASTTTDMVVLWNKAGMHAVAPLALPPMPESRIYAMMNTAMHDALNSIVRRYHTYALKNVRDPQADPDAAVAAAAHDVLLAQLPPAQVYVDSLLAASLSTVHDGERKTRGITLGKAAAQAILAMRANDGSETAQIPYVQGTLPGEYRSTPPFDGPPFNGFVAVPGWGNVKPFCMTSGAQFRPVPPYPINSADYTKDFNDVKTLGAAVGSTRTPDQTQIALFWLDNVPASFDRIAITMVDRYHLDAWKTARLFALLQLAEADANIACLEAKFHYNYWRPITAVRLGDSDGNPSTTGDPSWDVLAPPTPPVPDYPSNHSTNGGAGAAILASYFGKDDISFTQNSTSLPGVTRTLSGFSQAAMENALSRVYVGFHFRNACMKGVEQGYQVGGYVFKNFLREAE